MLSEFSLSSGLKAGQQASFVDMILNFREKLIRHKKNVLAFALLLVFGSILFGCASLLFRPHVVTYLQVGGFLLLGYFNTLMLQGNLSVLSATERFVYSLFAAFAVGCLLTVFHFASDNYAWFSVLAGSCAFLLPYSLMELWKLYSSMQSGSVKTWAYTDELASQKSTTFLNSIPVRFRVRLGAQGKNELPVSFRAPVRMQLGLIFYHLVQEQNSTGKNAIPLADEAKVPYQWQFFTTGINGKRYLDPETGLLENGVRENAIVFVQQVIE